MSLLKNCADGNLIEIKATLSSARDRRNKVETRDNHNWTCLHHAVISGNIECIKYLLTIPELDTTAETFEGETALHIACSIPNVSLEIISMLLEANIDLVNFVNNEEVDLLQCAITYNQNRIDMIKLLVDNGAPVNNQDLDGDTPLHIAAHKLQFDIIRYLLYETVCDPTIYNTMRKTACFLLFATLLRKSIENPPLLVEEISYFEEMAHFTFNQFKINNPYENEELSDMIGFLYRYNLQHSCLYMIIIKLLYVPPSSEYFVQRILRSNISSRHSLITALLQNNYEDNGHGSLVMPNFLCELFALFLSDESFFNEYISEIMSRNGWEYPVESQASQFCICIKDKKIDRQHLFSFLKILIIYEIDFNALVRACEPYLFQPDLLLTVFCPLVQFVIPSYPMNESLDYLSCNYNSNESENIFDNIERSLDLDNRYEVVSLKNLSRMSVRKYYFENYTHYSAIKTLYTLNIPVQVRNFLCYNISNYKF